MKNLDTLDILRNAMNSYRVEYANGGVQPRRKMWVAIIEQRGSQVIFSSNQVVQQRTGKLGNDRWKTTLTFEDETERVFYFGGTRVLYVQQASKTMSFYEWLDGRRDK